MDFSAPFKNEVFRPIATLLLPGAVALLPYAAVLWYDYPGLRLFLESHPTGYSLVFLLLALALGFILEDVGSRIEGLIWDELIEKETRCQQSDWHLFLLMDPVKDREMVGHRYLRTLTLRLKFELSIGLALLTAWIGVLWLDSIAILFSPPAVLWISSVLGIASGYAIWESYGTSWVLAKIRHLLVTGEELGLQVRTTDPEPWVTRYRRLRLGSMWVTLAWGAVLVLSETARQLSLRSKTGVVVGMLMLCFGIVTHLTGHWLSHSEAAQSRRRGLSLRMSFAYALLGAFLTARGSLVTHHIPYVLIAYAVLVCGAYYWVADALLESDSQFTFVPPTRNVLPTVDFTSEVNL